MNTHTHTPAPWEIEEPSKGCPSFIVHTDTDEIAFVLSSEHNDHGAANARLISTAPDLLAALKGCADALNEAGKSFALNNPDAVRPNMFEIHAENARAAIAKAEGREG